MENFVSNNSQTVIKQCPIFAERNKEAFGEFKTKLPGCLLLHSKLIFEVLQGKAQSPSFPYRCHAKLNAVAEQTCKQANQDLWIGLLLTMSGSASNAVNKFEGKKADDGTGGGHAAWEALHEEYNNHAKEARRTCHEKLVNTKIEPSQNPDDVSFLLDGCRDLLGVKGQTVHDERYEDTILQALPAEYERGQNASYEKRDFGLVNIRHMVHTLFVDSLSRPSHPKPVAGRGIAMLAAGDTKSDVRCSYCRDIGHLLPDCNILKANERRQEPNRWRQRAQPQHNQQAPRREKAKSEQTRKGRDGKYQ